MCAHFSFSVCHGCSVYSATHLPYDKEDESSAQHQCQHVAEGRKGECHGCASQPEDEMGRERERELPLALSLSGYCSFSLLLLGGYCLFSLRDPPRPPSSSPDASWVCIVQVGKALSFSNNQLSTWAMFPLMLIFVSFCMSLMSPPSLRFRKHLYSKSVHSHSWPDALLFSLWQAKCLSPLPPPCTLDQAYTFFFSLTATQTHKVSDWHTDSRSTGFLSILSTAFLITVRIIVRDAYGFW